jgi:uncharacterized protein (TIGR00369 family)
MAGYRRTEEPRNMAKKSPNQKSKSRKLRSTPASDRKSALLEIMREHFQKSRAVSFLGFEVEAVEKGNATLRMEVCEDHKQLNGVVHGGILAAMADTAAAVAAYTVIPKGAALATIELKINYLEAVPEGKIKANARILRAGRNFLVAECEIFTAKGALAAKALLTFGAASGHSLTA